MKGIVFQVISYYLEQRVVVDNNMPRKQRPKSPTPWVQCPWCPLHGRTPWEGRETNFLKHLSQSKICMEHQINTSILNPSHGVVNEQYTETKESEESKSSEYHTHPLPPAAD